MAPVDQLPTAEREASPSLLDAVRQVDARYHFYYVGPGQYETAGAFGLRVVKTGQRWWLIRYEPGCPAAKHAQDRIVTRTRSECQNRAAWLQDQLAAAGWLLDGDYTFPGEPPTAWVIQNIQQRRAEMAEWLRYHEATLDNPDADKEAKTAANAMLEAWAAEKKTLWSRARGRVMVQQPGIKGAA